MASNMLDEAIIGGRGGFGVFGGGDSSGGMFGGLLLGALLGNGTFGNRDNRDCAGPTAYQMGVNAGENATKDDIFGLGNTVNIGADRAVNASREAGNSIQAQLYAMNTGITAGFTGVDRGLCAVEGNIKDAAYANALLFKDNAAQLCGMENNLSRQADCNTQKILDTMCKDREAALMMKLNETERQRDLLATGNFPITQNASLVKQRCHDGGDINIAIGNSINTINDSLNRMTGILVNLAGALGTTATK